MKFKIGDKIKFIGIVPKIFINMEGVIEEIRPPNRKFPYYIRFNNGHGYPVMKWEVEKVSEKGEQLLFSFMSAMEGT